MAMILEKVVPFGRSWDEYVKMFNLAPTDLNGTVIGIGDGPASFNAEATQQGYDVVSVDPIYTFSGPEIQARFNAVVDDIINQVKATPDDWVWTYHQSPEALRTNRIQVLHRFLQDYDSGKAVGRYQIGELPTLPFPSGSFSLALCSHLLFLYSDQLSYEFHLRSIREMLRLAPEVRIFPLLTLMLKPSPHLAPVMQALSSSGYVVAIETVAYELQKGGNQMLVIRT
ncbi:SAM-dependent methyltransferase [Leptolyngbya sp. NK1-12]|uniref:SAM-dependent methyltransferase n=1 Tax=Leptolyngbya sp. NK1-12 TaxID=2547451 RepID=A0AA96WG67_9CYAN|nr:SAM-dependent methyltransferase [Leptolyngbya sp. NK1-12]WNZ24459.1 SAM-dependent methyltransferase [Leptolyngbya sp. NK1-12]